MTASIRKITISLPSDLLDYADRRAGQTQLSRSQVIGQALAEAKALEQARLAAEGYRFYAGESIEFADSSAQAVADTFSMDSGEGKDHDREAW
jgi:metal-responsive CopG/Arc/MetJ family transcriptional regulator